MHRLVDFNDGETACSACGSMWEYPVPKNGACQPLANLCFDDDNGRWRPHYFGQDGHCHNCGKVDR